MPQPLRAVQHTSDLAAGYLKRSEVPSTRNVSTAFEKGALEAQGLRQVLANSRDAEVLRVCNARLESLGYGR